MEDKTNEMSAADPPFISYLFTMKHRCVFIVGHESVEIGVDKCILMAHSEPFRLMLQDSALAEKGCVRVMDVQPNTFKNLLRFVYGNNILSTLTMEEAVNLMYVAEKYMVEELKPKLSTHICSMLSVDNVCIPLQRPECYMQKSLKDALDKTIQDFTDDLLQKQDFLDINQFGLLNILQQDTLAVTEIELWRGVLKWAKHNAKSEDCTTLRELLTEPLRYIRFCSMALEDFGKEVVLTKLLLDHEISMINYSIFSNDVLDNLVTVCNTTQTRNLSLTHCVKIIQFNSNMNYCSHCYTSKKSCIAITTDQSPIVMLAALFESNQHSVLGETKNLQFQCECKVSVTCVDYASNDSLDEPVVEFDFKKNVDYGKEFTIPLSPNGDGLKLSRYSKYYFSFTFQPFLYTYIKSSHLLGSNPNPLKKIDHGGSVYKCGYKTCHVKQFMYRSTS